MALEAADGSKFKREALCTVNKVGDEHIGD